MVGDELGRIDMVGLLMCRALLLYCYVIYKKGDYCVLSEYTLSFSQKVGTTRQRVHPHGRGREYTPGIHNKFPYKRAIYIFTPVIYLFIFYKCLPFYNFF